MYNVTVRIDRTWIILQCDYFENVRGWLNGNDGCKSCARLREVFRPGRSTIRLTVRKEKIAFTYGRLRPGLVSRNTREPRGTQNESSVLANGNCQKRTLL